MTTIYLCGPIAGCTDGEAMDWRERIKALLPECEFLDPMRRDYRRKDTTDPTLAREIVENDLHDIRCSDVVLAFHPRPSTGTDMEIMYASHLHIAEVVVIVPDGAPLSPWIVHHAKAVVKTEIEAVSWLRAQHIGLD